MTDRFPALGPPVSYPPKTCSRRSQPRQAVLFSLPLMELSLFAALGLLLALG
ncbi:hypothetical protein MCELHM10_03469 [Paracoccaceae bacterium]|jgi:hypothetical protein